MNSEGLGEVPLQTYAPENFCSCRLGDERTVKRAQTVSEDPHRRERKFSNINIKLHPLQSSASEHKFQSSDTSKFTKKVSDVLYTQIKNTKHNNM